MVDSDAPPVFLTTANELLERLGEDGSERARALAREAQQLADKFRSWELAPPAAHERAAAVAALLDLQRRTMDYLSRAPSSTKASERV